MNNFKMVKMSFLSAILACLVILYQASVLDLFAAYFTCEKDKKQDLPAGQYCCLNPSGGNEYTPIIQSSACSSTQFSFGQNVKVSDNVTIKVCPCNKLKIE